MAAPLSALQMKASDSCKIQVITKNTKDFQGAELYFSGIIRTKLYRTPVAEDIVCRKALHQRLDAGLKLPLTLVSAPAGYGKSTVISHWLQTSGQPYAWLSIDESDSDLRTFLSYFITAVRTLEPKACRETQAFLSAPDLPPGSALSASLCNELDTLKKRFVLVLDDYHRINELSIHELLDRLLQHPPRSLHLVIVSRRNPPLALATLRAGRLMTELRMADLKLTGKETAVFLKQATGKKIESPVLSRMQDRTEGWPVGLRLAALAMRGREDVGGFLADLDEGLGSMQDYLMGEVLARLAPAERECVCRTSILDRFCTPLCQALCGHRCGADCSREQKAPAIPTNADLLTICLDDQDLWHRYHHLFQKMLQRQLKSQLDADAIDELHLRAARWLEENECLDEAMQHLLMGSDPGEAARLIVRHRNAILNREHWIWLGKWLQRLPRRFIDDNPELLLMKVWFLQNRGRWEEAFESVKIIETLLAQEQANRGLPERLIASLDVLRGYRWWFAGQGARAVACADRAIKAFPVDCFTERGEALILLVISHQMIGALSQGREIAMKHLSDFSEKQATSFQSRVVAALGFADWMNADLPALIREGGRLTRLGAETGLPESLLVGHYFVGIASYLRNEIEEAEKNLISVVEGSGPGNAEFYIQAAFALALLYQNRGASEKAGELVERILTFGLDTRNTSVFQSARAFEADLALRQGRIPKAVKWAAQYDPDPLLPLYQFHAPPLTLAKIRLAQGDEVDRKETGLLLKRLEDYLRQAHNIRFLIDVLSLQALLYQSEGNEQEAIKRLGESINLARPGGAVRAFADLGPGLAPLLSRVDLDEGGVRFVGRILAAMQAAPSSVKRTAGGTHSGLVNPLSARELEIIALMAKRLSNREIGEKVFIPPGTVKRHAENIYQKLSVHTRRQAVAKAQGLGIL